MWRLISSPASRATGGKKKVATTVKVTVDSSLAETYPMTTIPTDIVLDVATSSVIKVTLTLQSSTGLQTHKTELTLLSSI